GGPDDGDGVGSHQLSTPAQTVGRQQVSQPCVVCSDPKPCGRDLGAADRKPAQGQEGLAEAAAAMGGGTHLRVAGTVSLSQQRLWWPAPLNGRNESCEDNSSDVKTTPAIKRVCGISI